MSEEEFTPNENHQDNPQNNPQKATRSWVEDLQNKLGKSRVTCITENARLPCNYWKIGAASWDLLASHAHALHARWAAGWADQHEQGFAVFVVLVRKGRYLLVETWLDKGSPEIASHSAYYPGASRCERHTHDMLGIRFRDAIDSRRWIRHQAWKKDEYPLRNDFPLQGYPESQTPADGEYEFQRIDGISVYEIPVGPIHAGVIEPGHFRFHAAGEGILQLEQHLGYVHKGIEKLAVGRDASGLARLAARISGDSTVAHSWAACEAMEQAASVTVSERATWLRGLLCERERVANHLGDIGAVCNDVGFAFAQMQFGRLREQWQRRSQQIFGHRMMMDTVIPGGVTHDISEQQATELTSEISALIDEVTSLMEILDDNASLVDRLATTGYLSDQSAQLQGALGYVGRASGVDEDVRQVKPYPPYTVSPLRVPQSHKGDVASRVKIREEELIASLQFQRKLLRNLPAGEIRNEFVAPSTPGVLSASVDGNAGECAQGLGIIEGWRGEIISYVRFDENGKIARFYPRDPSWFNWLSLQEIVKNNIVPDFPVCNKSVNGSYSGVDL